MEKKRNLPFIAYAYAIGALFVVLGHSTPTGASDLPYLVNEIRTFIYCFHMPLFLFIAGLLLYYTKADSRGSFSKYAKGKLVKFLTPYFVLSLVAAVPKVLLSSYVNDDVGFNFQFFVTAVFNPREGVWGHFWFLPTLLIIYFIGFFLLKIIKHNIYIYIYILVILRIVITLVVLVIAVFPINTNWFCVHDICEQFVYFWFGMIMCDFVVNLRQKVPKVLISTVCIIVAVVAFVIFRMYDGTYFQFVYQAAKIVIGLTMIVAVLCVSAIFENNGNKLLKLLNGKTFAIYIMSWPCQAVTEIIVNRVLHMHWYITLPAMFTVGLAMPLIVIFIYKKLPFKIKFIELVLGL